MKTGIELIADERKRQIELEGNHPKYDSVYTDNALVLAACCYALPHELRESSDHSFVPLPSMWPWRREFWKPTPELRLSELAKAGAFIAAEIDRIQNEKVSGEEYSSEYYDRIIQSSELAQIK